MPPRRAAAPPAPARPDRPDPRPRPEPAIGGVLLLAAAALVAILLAMAARYGYHRDELYFLQAGRHLDWGYPDQPPLTPLIARLMSAVAPDSLVALRVPAALAGAATVVLTGLIAREFGGGRAAQVLAACCVAFSASTFIIFHTLGTTAFDVMFWTLASWLVARQLRGADPRGWLWVGLAIGVGLQNKFLIAFLAVALLAGVAIGGPRPVLRSGWFWAGSAVAAVIWATDLIWQAAHGWPQLTLSSSIAAGASTSSQPWYLFVPFQLMLYSPLYIPIWAVGLWSLLRSPALRAFRSFGWAYVVLLVVFLVTGGKPYYLAGMYPALLAAGAGPVVGWASARARTVRRALVAGAVAVSLVVTAFLGLPLLPVASLGGSVPLAVNPDAGETVGWPALAAAVASARSTAPAGAVIVTRNYGEAGAVDRFGPALGLPPAFSGHNGYGLWGAPPDSATAAVVVGYSEADLSGWFDSCVQRATVDNGFGLRNQEQGRPVFVCTGVRGGWAAVWPQLVHLS